MNNIEKDFFISSHNVNLRFLIPKSQYTQEYIKAMVFNSSLEYIPPQLDHIQNFLKICQKIKVEDKITVHYIGVQLNFTIQMVN